MAVSTMADRATGTGGTSGGSAVEEVDSGGGGAPGNGRGRGLPLDAHAAEDRAIKMQSATRTPQPVCILDVESCIRKPHCNRLTPFVTWFLGMPILDTLSAVRHHVNSYGAGAPSQRVVRTSQGCRLAEGGHALVPGKGRGDRGSRPRDKGSVLYLQAAFRHPPTAFRQDKTWVRLRPVLPREHLRARQSHLSVLRRVV